jgi:hypothetical protein
MNSRSFNELFKGDNIIVYYPESQLARRELVTQIINTVQPSGDEVMIIRTNRTKSELSLVDIGNYHWSIYLSEESMNLDQARFEGSFGRIDYEVFTDIDEFLYEHPDIKVHFDE